MNIVEENDIPVISCSIFASFTNQIDGIAFAKLMKKRGITTEAYNCKAVNEFRVRIAHVPATECWEFSDAINKIILLVQDDITEIKKALIDHKGTCCIDIVCYKKDTYPAMLFDGDTMRFIHELNADLSIDMYDK